METALSYIIVLPSKKEEVLRFSDQLLESINAGEINPIDLKIHFKAIAEIENKIKPRLDELALTEAVKHGRKFDYQGSRLEIRDTGISYDYSKCNDPELSELMAKLEEAKEAVNQRQQFLRGLSKPMNAFDLETGETFTIYPPVRKGKESVTISLK
jgi:hypothetical protein